MATSDNSEKAVVKSQGMKVQDDWAAHIDVGELNSLFAFLVPGDVIEVRLETDIDNARKIVERLALTYDFDLVWAKTDDPLLFHAKMIRLDRLESRPKSGSRKRSADAPRRPKPERKTGNGRNSASRYGNVR